MKKIIVILLLTLSLCGCGTVKEVEEKNSEISLEEIMKEDNYIIVDVRKKEEYDESHVVGAINIPYDAIDENTELDKNKTIIVYCRSGNRSGIAKKTLTDLGYEVVDLGAFSSITLDKE